MHLGTCEEVRGQLVKVCFFPLLCGFQVLHSGHQAWQQYLYPLSHVASPIS